MGISKEIIKLVANLNKFVKEDQMYAYDTVDNLVILKENEKTKKVYSVFNAQKLLTQFERLEPKTKEKSTMAKKVIEIEEEELEEDEDSDDVEEEDDTEDVEEEEIPPKKAKLPTKPVKTKVVTPEEDDEEEEVPKSKGKAKKVKKESTPRKPKPRFDFEFNRIPYEEIMDKVKSLEANKTSNRTSYKLGGRCFTSLLGSGDMTLNLANVEEYDGATIFTYKGKTYCNYKITDFANDKKAINALKKYIKENLGSAKELAEQVKEGRSANMKKMQEARAKKAKTKVVSKKKAVVEDEDEEEVEVPAKKKATTIPTKKKMIIPKKK